MKVCDGNCDNFRRLVVVESQLDALRAENAELRAKMEAPPGKKGEWMFVEHVAGSDLEIDWKAIEASVFVRRSMEEYDDEG